MPYTFKLGKHTFQIAHRPDRHRRGKRRGPKPAWMDVAAERQRLWPAEPAPEIPTTRIGVGA